jgi:hypothetical protein
VHLVGFIVEKFVTMQHGHMDVKLKIHYCCPSQICRLHLLLYFDKIKEINPKHSTSIKKSTGIWNMKGKQTDNITGLIYYSLAV